MLLLKEYINRTFILTNRLIYRALFLLLIVFFACKKKNPGLGTDVQPETDALNVSVTEAIKVECHTVKYDSARSYMDQFKYLGSNQDLYFGRTDVGIFTNFSIPNNVTNISFGTDATLDSCVMFLTFTQSYIGDSTTTLNYNVYQLTSPVVSATSYQMFGSLNTSQFPSYDASPICNAKARLSTSGNFYTIKLPINKNFASAILTNPQYLVDNTTFQNAYKGFYISTKNTNYLNPTSAQGAIMKIDLDNSVSGIYMYYHNGPVAAAKESKVYRFPFAGNNSGRLGRVDYNPLTSGAHNLLTSQLSGDTTKGEQTIFLKGLGGTKALIRLPSLKSFSDTCKIAVSRAELKFFVDQSMISPSNGNYSPSLKASLVAIDSLGKEIYVKDQYYNADAIHFGGDYNSDEHAYTFDIARHVQDILDGKLPNFGFYLVIANPDRSYVARRDDRAERVILGGSKNPLYAPKFKLTYVRFPFDK